jgi:uracil-DNA glycosylase
MTTEKNFNCSKLINDPEIKESWRKLLKEIEEEIPESIIELENKINKDLELYDGNLLIFPPQENIFEAFKYFELSDTKVCINGQDPYHQVGQAHGLSFSVQDNIKIPPSLSNIFKELKNQYPEFDIPKTGNLTNWAKQGVLLLNSALTVLQNSPNFYQDYWTPITSLIMKKLSTKHQGKCIFMLWGNDAKRYKKNKSIDSMKHYILESSHPSPLSANRGGWFNNNHFKLANEYLKNDNKKEIKWIQI